MIVPVRNKKLIVVLILHGATYLVCFWAAIVLWRSEYRTARLRKVGVVTEATVTGSYPPSHRIPAELKYEFTHQGRRFTGSDLVSTVTQQSCPPGSIVQVRYLPDTPDFSSLAGKRNQAFRGIGFLGLCLMTFYVLLVLVLVARALVTRKRIFKPGAFWTSP